MAPKKRKKKRGRKPITRKELYKIAQKFDIPGRSKMNRARLLQVTRANRTYNRRTLAKGRKRIIIIKDGVAYEITARPRPQTPRGKSMDRGIKARSRITFQDLEGFGWIGDTSQDLFEFDMAHPEKHSKKEAELIAAITSKAGIGKTRKGRGTKISMDAKKLAKREKISVIAAQHMMNDLDNMGVDPRTIDEMADEIDFASYESASEAYRGYTKQKIDEVFYY